MALRGQVVDLVGLDRGEQRDQARAVGQVAVVQEQSLVLLVRIRVQVVDPVRVERAGAADQAVHLVPLAEQQLGQVRAVLARDPRDQRLLHALSPSCSRYQA
jgi:hypothetical protein